METALEGTSIAASENLAKENTNLRRELYLERRRRLEKAFLKPEEPRKEIVELEDGARIKVLSSVFKVPEELKSKPSDMLRITVFVPGMFNADDPNYGNHPLEVKLAGSILTGDVDGVIMLKGEGLNSEAYKNEDGEGAGQKKTSSAAVEILKRRLLELKRYQDQPVEFRVLGYSEGSTQGASIAARLVEEFGAEAVKEYVSIGGGGLSGPEDQNQTEVIPKNLAINNIRSAPKPPQLTEYPYFIREGYNFYLDPRLLGSKESGGLEESLGTKEQPRAKVSLPADIYNIGKWTLRHAATRIPFLRNLPVVEQVPPERLQATWSKNPDYELLAENKVPLKLFAGYKDIFFNWSEVKDSVDSLRQKYGTKIILLSSDVGHEYPHNNPSGVAYALEIAGQQKINSSSSVS